MGELKIFNVMAKNKKNTLKEQIVDEKWLTVEEAIEAINKAFQSLEEKQI